MIIGY